MFLVIITYKVAIEEIENALAEHILFLDTHYEKNKFIFSGRRNPRVGGVILVNSDSVEEVKAIVEKDPFYQKNLADYELVEFNPTKYDRNFQYFINQSKTITNG